MPIYNIGDIVARKSYGADMSFVISKITISENRGEEYVLKGLEYRIQADANANDLIRLNPRVINLRKQRVFNALRRQTALSKLVYNPYAYSRLTRRPGKILHIDASLQFLRDSMNYYRSRGLRPIGVFVDEPDQSKMVKSLLQQYQPDIVVLTGHDGIKKGSVEMNTFDSYKNSRYYANAIKEARSYEPNPERLFIFAGACQSYYEALMSAGASFASSPGRVMVHSFDPVIVSQRISTTDSKKMVTVREAVRGTASGSKGIGGMDSRGRLTWV